MYDEDLELDSRHSLVKTRGLGSGMETSQMSKKLSQVDNSTSISANQKLSLGLDLKQKIGPQERKRYFSIFEHKNKVTATVVEDDGSQEDSLRKASFEDSPDNQNVTPVKLPKFKLTKKSRATGNQGEEERRVKSNSTAGKQLESGSEEDSDTDSINNKKEVKKFREQYLDTIGSLINRYHKMSPVRFNPGRDIKTLQQKALQKIVVRSFSKDKTPLISKSKPPVQRLRLNVSGIQESPASNNSPKKFVSNGNKMLKSVATSQLKNEDIDISPELPSVRSKVNSKETKFNISKF